MLTERFDAALLYAHQIHRAQIRKGTAIPYIAHVIGVASIALEYGATETQAIAALLHDTLEDAPRALGAGAVRREIRERFGDEVLAIVEHCTDTDEQPKPPWRARKSRYLERLAHAPADALLVSAADKLHNLRALLRDFRMVGDELWRRFNPEAGRAGTVGYHRALVDTFARRLGNPIVGELERVLADLEHETGGRCEWPPRAAGSTPPG
jgi:(p)ppGpp synthase/HD superfamily hydrolase